MVVWIAAAAAFSVYFCMIPVYIAFFVRMRDSLRIGAGASLLLPRLAVHAAQKRAETSAEEEVRGATRRNASPLKKAGGFHLRAFPAAWKLLGMLAADIRLESFSATGRLCAGDAARTAMLCGFANILSGAFAACGSQVVRLNLAPDFSAGAGDVRIVGMVSVRIGHIIRAAILHIKELKDLWKSTRSKA